MATSVMGIAMVSLFPATLSYGAELTFPLQPALVNASMNFMGQMMSFCLTGLAVLITDIDASDEATVSQADVDERKANTLTAVLMFTAVTVIACLLAFFVKEDLRRVNFKAIE